MSNGLTGDFEAVLQVSGGTVNRLMASMHQNGFTNPNTPSFPHIIHLRIGDDHAIDNVRGLVKAQVASPIVELIDGVTDRFWLRVGVRARYVPDGGSNPLPAFINGTVRAQYRIEEIDPNCFGWAQLAADYIWVRVVKDTVSFHGSTAEDQPSYELQLSGSVEDHGAIEAKITRQIAALLATRYEATPQRVSKRFRRGSMRSLVPPVGDSAVVIPIAVNGDPVGNIASVGQVLLNGADFAIAISRDALLGLAQPALAQIQGFKATVKVYIDSPWYSPLPDVDTVYHVTTNTPVIEWHAYGSFAAIKVKVHGNATTNSILPNASFDIEQDITLNFDGGNEVLWLGVGSRKVSAHVNGPLGGLAEDQVKNGIENAVKPIIENAIAAAQPGVNATIGRKQELITQLRGLDAAANARFTDAGFEHDGMILRGRISLSARAVPVVFFEKTIEQDGFTAIRSWIPGGRIDKFDWTWSWFTSGKPGGLSYDDRFVLRRPSGYAGKWGQMIDLETPLPGLDGSGKVCLQIRGAYMDPVTGEMKTVNASYCHRFGFNIYVKVGDAPGTILVPDLPELSQDVPFPQLTLVDLASGQPGSSSNTLIVYAGRDANREMAGVLREGLEGARRPDAGLALLVIVPEGQLAAAYAEPDGLLADVRRTAERLGLATVFAEDVGNHWASALNVGSDRNTVWRLTDPRGDVRWIWGGRVTGDALMKALDHNLVTSVNPKSEIIGAAIVGIGKQIGIDLVRPDVIGRHCPPLPLGRAGAGGTVVTFVLPDSAASETHLRDLAARQQRSVDTAPDIVVIVGGAEQADAETYVARFGHRFIALADPRRTVTSSFGVRIWPTTFSLDRVGKVEAIETGVSGRGRRGGDKRSEATAL
jgi:hypothetical protein